MPPSRRSFGAAALVSLFAATLSGAPRAAFPAGDEPPKRPGSKPAGDGFKFTPPSAPARPSEAAKPPPGKPADAPKDPLEQAVRGLATWPGLDGVKAAETLLLAGPAS